MRLTAMTKEDRINIAELFADGFTITELALMYEISVFRVMGFLEQFGIEV